MKPVFQTQFGTDAADASTAGNCFAACIASVLEIPIEDVPNFVAILDESPENNWWAQTNRFLRERAGLELLEVNFLAEETPYIPGYYLVCGRSPRQPGNHTVVYANGEMVHDPHPDGGGLLPGQRLGDEYVDHWSYDLFIAVDPARLVGAGR